MSWFCCIQWFSEASQAAQTIRKLPAIQETQIWSLGWKDPLKKGMAPHSSILGWRIPWTKYPFHYSIQKCKKKKKRLNFKRPCKTIICKYVTDGDIVWFFYPSRICWGATCLIYLVFLPLSIRFILLLVHLSLFNFLQNFHPLGISLSFNSFIHSVWFNGCANASINLTCTTLSEWTQHSSGERQTSERNRSGRVNTVGKNKVGGLPWWSSG